MRNRATPFPAAFRPGRRRQRSLDLSLQGATQRALKYNLGEIESSQNARAAHAVRLRSLNALLPNLSARISGVVEQVDLPAEGFNLHIPGVNIPTVVGPFGVADARAYLTQEVFNWSSIKNWKSAAQGETAAQYSYKSDRDLGGRDHRQRLSAGDFRYGHRGLHSGAGENGPNAGAKRCGSQ